MMSLPLFLFFGGLAIYGVLVTVKATEEIGEVTVSVDAQGENLLINTESDNGRVLVNGVDLFDTMDKQTKELNKLGRVLTAQNETISALWNSGIFCPINATAFENVQSGRQLFGEGILARDGNIYVLPGDSSYIGIIKPTTFEWDVTTYPITYTTLDGSLIRSKFNHGTLGSDGKIYGVGGRASHLLIFDPKTGAIDVSTVACPQNNANIFQSPSTGKLYALTNAASAMFIFNPSTNVSGSVPVSGGGEFADFLLGPDGKGYGIPTKTNSVLVFDPATNVTDRSLATPRRNGGFSNAVLAPNNLIYAIPRSSSDSVLVIDPFLHKVDFTSISVPSGYSNGWLAGVYIGNGKIIAIPQDTMPALLIIDTNTNTVDYSSVQWHHGQGYETTTVGEDGRVYAVPRDGPQPIITIDPFLAPCNS
eukprot:m.39239 g.39239  ORF g.39239 m.39239 type:complete len:420 (-) comp6851_c0_seq1:164-1423(-)